MSDATTLDPPEGGEQPDREAAASARRFGPWRREVRAFLELLALAGIAVAQPYFDVLSKNAELFVTRGTTGLQLVLLTALVVLAPPLVLYAVEVIVGLVAPAGRRVAHGLVAAAAVALIALEVAKHQTALGPHELLAVAVVVGLLGGWLVWRFAGIRTWLRVLSIAPVVFGILFVTSSSVSDVVFQAQPAASGATVGKPSRVVMIVMDELPLESLLGADGTIDATLFPNFAALARGSTWYRNNSTVAPFTEAAVPAILTGQLPTDPNALPVATAHPQNLFTLLGGTYDLNVHESLTRLCPPHLCGASHASTLGQDSGFEALVDDATSLWQDYASPSRTSQTPSFIVNDAVTGDVHAGEIGQRFVDSLEPATAPRLDFLHVLLPHQPWRYLPTGQEYTVPAANPGLYVYGWATDWGALSGRQRHLLQLQYADRLLGQIVAKLRSIRAYQSSLLVVTADHGASFTKANDVRGASAENYPQIGWPPLFIKAPGQTVGKVDDRPALNIDIVPTIEQYLAVKQPWHVDGRSLLGPARPEGKRPLFEWILNQLKPTTGKYVQLDGPAGFAAVLRGRASEASGDPAMRLYRIGPYAAFVGQPVSSVPQVTGATPPVTATIPEAASWDAVHLHAKVVTWEYLEGFLDAATDGQQLAVAVNGVLAGFPVTYLDPNANRQDRFWLNIPPTLLHNGKNTISLYQVGGTPAAPTLAPVHVNR